MRIRRPTILRDLKVEEAIFFSSLSRSSLQDECFITESIKGAPRYLVGREEMEKPKILAMFL
jgi:hypothetical protein